MSGSQLIGVSELNTLLSDPKLLLLDVRYRLTDPNYGRTSFEAGHIPGARFADLKADVAGVCSGSNGRTPLPDSGRFCVNMRRLGLNPDSVVVVYDDGESNFAARLWFTLRWVGFANVRVLNGGFTAWKAAGLAVVTQQAEWEAGTYRATTPLERVFDDDFVERNLEVGDYTLVDARAHNRYTGEVEHHDPKAGHIPGSLNRPSLDNLTADKLFKDTAELKREFEAVFGGVPHSDIINTCGSGVTACCNHLAMMEAGIPAAGVYIGSWSEWVSDENRPIKTGEEP